MARARSGATVIATVAALTAVVVGIPLAVLALRGGGRGGAPPATAERAAHIRQRQPLAEPAPISGQPVTPADAALVALTRRVPCPGRAGPRVSREELARFGAKAAVTCDREQRTIDGAVWEVAVRRVAASGVQPLLAALRLPSEQRKGTAACTANIVLLPPLALVDAARRYVVPPVPVDVCDHPLQEAIRAVNGLRWREVSARQVKQVVSPEALAAGCTMEYKDMPWLDAQSGTASSLGGSIARSTPRSARVCFYRVSTADHGVGWFVRGRSLGATATRRLLLALAGPGPSAPCPDVRDFAVVDVADGPAPVVELGGCWRVDRPGGLGSADARAVRAILARH